MMMPNLFGTVRMACEFEVSAIKAGNVHPQASFHDTTSKDFVDSARIIEQVWQQHPNNSTGQWIYDAVREVQSTIGKNTNLGIILLLAPLCKAAMQHDPSIPGNLPSHQVLAALNGDDADWVYQAIRLAKPGGLGQSTQHDIHAKPPACLISAMQLAADYDDIARQYVTNFADVYDLAQRLFALVESGETLIKAIETLQIVWLSERIDTLIARKCGRPIAEEVRIRAERVLAAGHAHSDTYQAAWRDFDSYLRSDSNRMNPGTTADLLAAAIFVYLLQSRDIHDPEQVSSRAS